jgi:hypothetical protein
MKTILLSITIPLLAVAAFAGLNVVDTSEFKIVGASYGTGDQRIEVTDALRTQISHRILLLRAPWGFGPDPAPGIVKDIKIMYRHNGVDANATFSQHQDIVLPPPPRGLAIIRASYGLPDRRVDVTEEIRSAMTNGSLTTQPHWSFGRIDPADGIVKTVEITYVHAGNVKTVTISQNDGIKLP